MLDLMRPDELQGKVVGKFATLQQRIRKDDFIQCWEGLLRW